MYEMLDLAGGEAIDDRVRHHLNQVGAVGLVEDGVGARRRRSPAQLSSALTRTRQYRRVQPPARARPLCRLKDWRGESAP